MPLAIVVQLLAQFGLPLTQQIFEWYKAGKIDVTPDDFAMLEKLAAYRSADSLAAAGIKIVNGKVVAV